MSSQRDSGGEMEEAYGAVELATVAVCPVTHQMHIEHPLGGKQALMMQGIDNDSFLLPGSL